MWEKYEEFLLEHIIEKKVNDKPTLGYLENEREANVSILLEKLGSLMKEIKEGTRFDSLCNEVRVSLLVAQLTGIISSTLLVSPEKKREIENHVWKHVLQWLKDSFGLWNSQKITFHTDKIDPIIGICRAALFRLLNAYLHLDKELEAVFYLPVDENTGRMVEAINKNWDKICNGVNGISKYPIIQLIPPNTYSETMDIGYLTTIIASDLSYHQDDIKRTPCMIFCRAGTPISNELDNYEAIKRLCVQHFMWLHVQGEMLTVLLTQLNQKPPRESQTSPLSISNLDISLKQSDSLTVDLGGWFNMNLSIPKITFFQSVDWSGHSIANSAHLHRATTELIFDSPIAQVVNTVPENGVKVLDITIGKTGRLIPSSKRKDSGHENQSATLENIIGCEHTLPIWVFSEVVGTTTMKVRITQAFELVAAVTEKIDSCPFLARIDQDQDSSLMSLIRYHPCIDTEEIHNKLGHLDWVKAALEYLQDSTDSTYDVNEDPITEMIKKCNIGTKYIYSQTPSSQIATLNLQLIDVQGLLFIRYSPLKSVAPPETQAECLLNFMEGYINQSYKIYTCSIYSGLFEQIVNVTDNVKFVKPSMIEPVIAGFDDDNAVIEKYKGEEAYIGLGGISYIPTFLGEHKNLDNPSEEGEESYKPEIIKEIELLNHKISSQCTRKSTIFIAGKTNPNHNNFNTDFLEADDFWGDKLEGGGTSNQEIHQCEWKNCLRVGVDDEPYTPEKVQEIVDFVKGVGEGLEKDAAVVDHLSNYIKKGIKEAERELKNDHPVSIDPDEGILAHIPLLGRMYTWAYPTVIPRPALELKAKSFTIARGFSTRSIPATPRVSMSVLRDEVPSNLLKADNPSIKQPSSSAPSVLDDADDEMDDDELNPPLPKKVGFRSDSVWGSAEKEKSEEDLVRDLVL